MGGNTTGKIFSLTSFGESHGPAIGGVIDGCPAGLDIDTGFIEAELDRRKTGRTPSASARREDDKIEFLSGIFHGISTGAPIAYIIRNKDQRPEDYSQFEGAYRPSHADFTYEQKYGLRDHRGGGRASARETAVRVVGGSIAKLFLKKAGIFVRGYVSQIGTVELREDFSALDLSTADSSPVCCPDLKTSDAMVAYLDELKQQGDTAGGTVTCVITGVPAGLGEPVFDRLEASLGHAILSINAVKAFDIGSGFGAATAKGLEHNDRFVMKNGKIATATNRSGGVQGGITNGEDIYFRAFFKPVATLMQDLVTINRSGQEVLIKGKGRHDVCVVPRAVPIVEAMAALTMADFILRNRAARI
jgi:chorismate synthase